MWLVAFLLGSADIELCPLHRKSTGQCQPWQQWSNISESPDQAKWLKMWNTEHQEETSIFRTQKNFSFWGFAYFHHTSRAFSFLPQLYSLRYSLPLNQIKYTRVSPEQALAFFPGSARKSTWAQQAKHRDRQIILPLPSVWPRWGPTLMQVPHKGIQQEGGSGQVHMWYMQVVS
jgi:hypothetical protein